MVLRLGSCLPWPGEALVAEEHGVVAKSGPTLLWRAEEAASSWNGVIEKG